MALISQRRRPGLSRRAVIGGAAACAFARVNAQAGDAPEPGFDWQAGDLSEALARDPRGAIHRAATGDPRGRLGAWVRRTDGVLRPEWFGAAGDGVTNDSAALGAMADYVSSTGGGTIAFRKATYLVGEQRRAAPGVPGYAYEPAPLLEFSGCHMPLVLRGNGARLLCAPALRFGTFDRATGLPTRHKLPFHGGDELATPYRWMIKVSRCAGRVEISDLELDGNVGALSIGGQYDDAGWQIPCTGIGLYDNTGDEMLARLRLHHHALDGLIVDGIDSATTRAGVGRINDLRCENNGRQGCSVTGGRGYRFERAHFVRTGRGPIASAPAAGVDLEAEGGKKVRDIAFVDCRFADNVGVGLVAEAGDVADVRLDRCRFVGTTNWAAWPNKPGMTFSRCTFAGALVNAFGDDKGRAARFLDCTFTDDRSQSPTGRLYYGENPDHPIASLPFSRNAAFVRCRFLLSGEAVLPWSVGVVYRDCTMVQRSTKIAYPRGIYQGINRITGVASIGGSKIRGTVILNGKLVPRV